MERHKRFIIGFQVFSFPVMENVLLSGDMTCKSGLTPTGNEEFIWGGKKGKLTNIMFYQSKRVQFHKTGLVQQGTMVTQAAYKGDQPFFFQLLADYRSTLSQSSRSTVQAIGLNCPAMAFTTVFLSCCVLMFVLKMPIMCLN